MVVECFAFYLDLQLVTVHQNVSNIKSETKTLATIEADKTMIGVSLKPCDTDLKLPLLFPGESNLKLDLRSQGNINILGKQAKVIHARNIKHISMPIGLYLLFNLRQIKININPIELIIIVKILNTKVIG